MIRHVQRSHRRRQGQSQLSRQLDGFLGTDDLTARFMMNTCSSSPIRFASILQFVRTYIISSFFLICGTTAFFCISMLRAGVLTSSSPVLSSLSRSFRIFVAEKACYAHFKESGGNRLVINNRFPPSSNNPFIPFATKIRMSSRQCLR